MGLIYGLHVWPILAIFGPSQTAKQPKPIPGGFNERRGWLLGQRPSKVYFTLLGSMTPTMRASFVNPPSHYPCVRIKDSEETTTANNKIKSTFTQFNSTHIKCWFTTKGQSLENAKAFVDYGGATAVRASICVVCISGYGRRQ